MLAGLCRALTLAAALAAPGLCSAAMLPLRLSRRLMTCSCQQHDAHQVVEAAYATCRQACSPNLLQIWFVSAQSPLCITALRDGRHGYAYLGQRSVCNSSVCRLLPEPGCAGCKGCLPAYWRCTTTTHPGQSFEVQAHQTEAPTHPHLQSAKSSLHCNAALWCQAQVEPAITIWAASGQRPLPHSSVRWGMHIAVA